MKIAVVTTDNREYFKTYGDELPSFGTAPEALLEGFAGLTEVEIHVIACARRIMPAPSKIEKNIWFHSVVVPKWGWMRTCYAGCVLAVRKKMAEIRPDIVHGQGTERDNALCAVFSGFPNVLTIHGNMKGIAKFYGSRPGSFYWLAAKLENLAFKKTSGVFCNSAYTESLVSPRTRRTWRLPNALREAFFELPLTAVDQRPPKPVLVNIGVLSPYKQQAELLAVARKLWERGLRFEIHFAGGMDAATDYCRDFMQSLAEAEKAGYARHLGSLSLQELIGVLDKASAIVHVPAEEAFGLVAAEALARNLKLFGFAAGGVSDIASGVEMAELVPAQDWQGLENSIARWIQAGFPRPTTAAMTMQKRYHPLVIAKRHLEIYHEVLSTRS